MVIVTESAAALKGFIAQTGLAESARLMVLRLVLGIAGGWVFAGGGQRDFGHCASRRADAVPQTSAPS